MRPIQIILILFLMVMAGLYIIRLRNKTYHRLIVLIFIVTGVVMVIMPDWTTAIAQRIGVGRGADLILYLGLVGLSFICMLLYLRIRELEVKLTELVRLTAIKEAYKPEQAFEGNDEVAVNKEPK